MIYKIKELFHNSKSSCVALIILSVIFLLISYIYFLKNHTAIIHGKIPKHLITNGLYSYTRNPLYVSLTVFLAGFAVFLGNVSAFMGAPIFMLSMNIFVIPHEENALEKRFGYKYRDYKNHVRRWV